MTTPSLTFETVTALDVARGMRNTMDGMIDGILSETDGLPILASMLDHCLPHYAAIFEVDAWAAENMSNAAEWLDRLDELPSI